MPRTLFLLRELVRRDFSARYAGSALGFAWSFAQPLWQLLLFTFVFSTVLRISPLGERTESFAVFLFCGLLPWLAVHEGVLRGATAVTDNANLVKKLAFPPEILVVTVAATALLHEAIAGAVFVVVIAALGELAWRGLPWLLVAVPLQVALTLGLGLLVAALTVVFRDTTQILGMLLAAWFYCTPIVYPLALVPETYRSWIAWNPMSLIVELYRSALLGGPGPRAGELATLTAVAAAVLVAGWWLFARLKAGFSDEV